jgi:hypothetical protein
MSIFNAFEKHLVDGEHNPTKMDEITMLMEIRNRPGLQFLIHTIITGNMRLLMGGDDYQNIKSIMKKYTDKEVDLSRIYNVIYSHTTVTTR